MPVVRGGLAHLATQCHGGLSLSYKNKALAMNLAKNVDGCKAWVEQILNNNSIIEQEIAFL